jgi:hypothetical protein
MQAAVAVDGPWCVNTKCYTCVFEWWICQPYEVSLPSKKMLNQHRKLCHSTPLNINEDNYDSDDEAFMGGLI